jgi:hypothetical protein
MANPFTGGAAGFSGIDYLAPEVAQQQREIQRQQAIADLLRQQSLEENNQTQVVSGWAIPNSSAKRFSQLGQALMAGYMQRKIDGKQAAVAQQLAERLGGVSYAPASQSSSATAPMQPGTATSAPIVDGSVTAPSFDSRKTVAPGATGGSGSLFHTAMLFNAVGIPIPPEMARQMAGVQPTLEFEKIDTGDGTQVVAFNPLTGQSQVVSSSPKNVSPDTKANIKSRENQGDLDRKVTTQGQNMTANTAAAARAIDAARLSKPEIVVGPNGAVYQIPGMSVPGYPAAPSGAPASTPASTPAGIPSATPSPAGAAPQPAPAGLVPVVPGKTVKDKAAEEIEIDAAKAQALAFRNLPDVLAGVERSVKLVKDLKDSPDLDKLVGNTTGKLTSLISGTTEADLQARINQIKGDAFIQAFQDLKGGGAVSETEGEKATTARTRMSEAQSVKEFQTAAQEYIDVMEAGAKSAKRKAGVKVEDEPPKPTDSSSAPVWTPELQAELEQRRAEARARFGAQK